MPTIEELHRTLPTIALMLEWADHHDEADAIYARLEAEGWKDDY
ncbi:hypothetical protein [uncultured Sphingosinicella sp.]|tara:strand:+ start:22494 stop:22625 length:132 start_codon:yes stop_codon:yes gene_type:complete